MTTVNQYSLYTAQAQSDLSAQSSRYKVVNLNGTLFAGAANTLGAAIGVNYTTARSGEYFSYAYSGITKCVAGAAVATVGYPCVPASGGFMIAASSGFLYVGRFLELANSGDFVQAIIDFVDPGAWAGT